MHEMRRAVSFAWLNAGNSIAARMAMMAMTTNSSIKVKAAPTRKLFSRWSKGRLFTIFITIAYPLASGQTVRRVSSARRYKI